MHQSAHDFVVTISSYFGAAMIAVMSKSYAPPTKPLDKKLLQYNQELYYYLPITVGLSHEDR